ncbi:MAG: leucine-rich repeat protein, partial [Oscillospiraceae bacterium]|nr:leucine-rich repeat protein [Oscillospiraceae bacterium]
MKKRFLALFLLVCMLLTAVPAAAAGMAPPAEPQPTAETERIKEPGFAADNGGRIFDRNVGWIDPSNPPGSVPRPDVIQLQPLDVLTDAQREADEILDRFLELPPEMFLWTDGFYLDSRYRYVEDDELTYTADMKRELCETAASIAGGCATAGEAIEAVAVWLALNVCYDYEYVAGRSPYPNCDPYTVLQNRYTVCNGYAQLAEYLIQSLGIPCVYVLTDTHAYNLAYDGSRWIIFDATWMSSGRYESGTWSFAESPAMDMYDVSRDFILQEPDHVIIELPLTLCGGVLKKYPEFSPLESYAAPAYVTSIADWAFSSCTGLKTLTVPGSVTVGYCAFGDSLGPETVNFGSTAEIGESAFYNSSGLKTLAFGSNAVIGKYAFYNCSGLKSMEFKGSADIGEWAFQGCSGLTSVQIKGGAELASSSFQGDAALQTLTLGGSAVIGDNAFADCAALSSLTVPGAAEIGDGAFSGCAALTSVSLGNGGEAIGQYAFWGCGSLGELTLGKGLKTVGYAAFYNCPLTKVSFRGTEAEWRQIVFDAFNDSVTGAEVVYLTGAVPETPELIGASAAEGSITVTWKAVDGATKYKVYRKTGSGSWTGLKDVTGTDYTDTSVVGGTTYTYTVKAYNGVAWSAFDTKGVTATAKAAFGAPELIGASAAEGSITVTWKAVGGATKYKVYRKTGSG